MLDLFELALRSSEDYQQALDNYRKEFLSCRDDPSCRSTHVYDASNLHKTALANLELAVRAYIKAVIDDVVTDTWKTNGV